MSQTQIEPKTLDQIEYLLYQSTKGVHFLFDKKEISQILKTPTNEEEFFSQNNIDKVQQLFNDFLNKKSIVEKQIYLSNLDKESFEILVRTYFHIVENSVNISHKQKH